jgi:lipopolysaccharide biosynthesis glycosyltransferase
MLRRVTSMRSSGSLPPIVCAVDDRYSGQLCVLLQSIADAHGPASDLWIIVLHLGLDASTRERILFHADRLRLRVELRRVPDPPARLPLTGLVTAGAYLRLSMPEALAGIPRALYLDADLLVLDDLRPLLCSGLDGLPLAAVRDAVNPVLSAGPALRDWRGLGLPGSREYFNIGVMLLDVAACRDIFADAHRVLREGPEHILYWDQDALNIVVADAWRRLERRWNAFAMACWTALGDRWAYGGEAIVPYATLVEDERSAAILHYAGSLKPWHAVYPASSGKDRYGRLLATVKDSESASRV